MANPDRSPQVGTKAPLMGLRFRSRWNQHNGKRPRVPGNVPYLGQAQAFVRVTGTRRDAFVEFEFSINDEDLTVDLVMPVEEFREFCERENVTVLPPDETVRSTVERFLSRERKAGRLTVID
jgi:phenol hydroxylase P0 protein